MAKNPLVQSFTELNFEDKFILVGAALGAISVFCPWYIDMDKFNSGFGFYGITGPLYAIGWTLLAMNLFTAGMVIFQKKIQSKFQLPFDFGDYLIAQTVTSLYLLFLAYSIYFHPKFGFNIVDKQPRFGLGLALLAVITLAIGSYIKWKNRSIEENSNPQEQEEISWLSENQALNFQRSHHQLAEENTPESRPQIHYKDENGEIPIRSDIRSRQ